MNRQCVLVGLAMAATAGTAAAQRPRPPITWGEGYGVTDVAPLDPQLRAEVLQDTGFDATDIGFRYYRWCLFADGFNFWTSDGEYVLANSDSVARVNPETQKTLAEMAGHHKPLAYRLLFGWLAVLAGVVGLWLAVRRSPDSQAERLRRDPRYTVAYAAYAAALPDDGPPTADHRRAGLTAGVSLLADEYDVSPRKAERNLRLIAQQAEKAMSFEMRAVAFEHEQAGDLSTAAALLEQAAHYGAFWEPVDEAFVLKNLNRVRAKLAVGQSAAGPPLSDDHAG